MTKAAVLQTVDGAPLNQGPSILQTLTSELDIAYRRGRGKKCKHRHLTQGVAVGLAHAISIMINPYNPNIDQVQKEARERYESSCKKTGKGKKGTSKK